MTEIDEGVAINNERIISGLLFIGMGSLIMIVFSPWRPLLDKNLDYIGRFVLVALLLMASILFKRSKTPGQYVRLNRGFIILAIAVSLDIIFGRYIMLFLGVNDLAPMGWAVQKLNEAVVVLSTVIALSMLSGDSLRALYIQKGHLHLGLAIGFTLFFVAAAGSIPMANLFYGNNLTLQRIVPWIPWVLIFVLCNAAMEEIMFRGLFLQKMEPVFGKFGANLLIAIVFTLMHKAVTYSVDNYIFLAVLFPLALLWGFIMQKTKSVWGSILFHAGMDIPIILGIFSNL